MNRERKLARIFLNSLSLFSKKNNNKFFSLEMFLLLLLFCTTIFIDKQQTQNIEIGFVDSRNKNKTKQKRQRQILTRIAFTTKKKKEEKKYLKTR